MQTIDSTLGTIWGSRRLMRTTVALGLLLVLGFAQSAFAQSTLALSNNRFVIGDYVVGGVGLRGLGDATGFATGSINIPDQHYSPSQSVPPGADIVDALLYWETVESTNVGAVTGQQGFFRGYPITGTPLGNPNAPTSWSSGGCTGASGGSKTMRTYRADVSSYLQIDADGNVQPNISYQVRLPDSGSNGGGVPLTLGATLVIIYRVLDKNAPLNAITIYDGAYAPSNSGQTMSQSLNGFYEPTQPPGVISAKLTHIVGNGQSNKLEQVLFNGNAISPANTAAFPGVYNGSWDNPTYAVGQYVNAGDTLATTSVVPTGSVSGCVNWGAVIFSTTVQDSDNDGLLDVWKTNQGYCDPTDTSGTCDSTHSSWVALPGAKSGQQDVFVQLDYMCSLVSSAGTCDTSQGQHSHLPGPQVLANLTSAFSSHRINLHIQLGNAIQEQACTDSTDAQGNPVYCSFPGPNEAGVVGWKAGFEYLQYLQPLNPTDPTCISTGVCERRFQFGRKDSYHYAIFGHALAVPNWSFLDGTLVSMVASGNTVSFTTSTPNNLIAGTDRVTVADAISNPNLNGVYIVQTSSGNTFTIQIPNATTATYTHATDPRLSVASRIGTGSGYSDVGGANSLITLGLWGADGQTLPALSGTFMHELGHSMGLTHGGYYRDTPPSYAVTFEPNCKPNYQSVMNYLFQVDLLGPNGALDYSSQQLASLNEENLGPVSISTTDGSPIAHPTTRWYDVVQPNGVGSPATSHCDGSPLSSTDANPTMFSQVGPTPPPANPDSTIAIPLSHTSLDVNFDGILSAAPPLRGYNDWANIDLRQIGATGSDFLGGGGKNTVGGGKNTVGGGKNTVGGGKNTVGGGKNTVGGGVGEVSYEAANSVVRPPRTLTDAPADTRASHSVTLNWNLPSFGQIGSYNAYRGTDGATPTLFYPPNPPNGAPLVTTTSYTDNVVVDCTAYTYFVTSILAADGRESVPSNSVQYAVPCPPTGLQATQSVSNNAGSVTLNWTGASTASGNILGYNVYRVVGTDTTNMTLLTPTPVAAINYTDTSVANHTIYTYSVTTVPVDQTGCHEANSYCRESTQATLTITVQYKLQQTITFAQLPDKTYGDQDLVVSATASSGLPVSFTASSASNCTLGGNTVHIVHAGSCTVTASQVGDSNYYPAPDVPNTFTIKKANATIGVTGYSVTYDGNAHTATGTATGVKGENLSGLNLSGTAHTNVGTYTDSWIFTDVTGNYNNANGSVNDSIAKANPTIAVIPYSVSYDGSAHTATGTATGVKGENLSGLNLSGTAHTNAGTYADSWTFTDVTGNYNNASGTITDSIIKGNSTTTITSISPSPSVLGQAFTVNFAVSHVSGIGTPTGKVTASDVSGATCTSALTAGIGKCVLTLPEVLNGKAVVGTRTLTATYAGDTNFSGSSGTKTQQVIYTFTGFYSPLSPAGNSSNAGTYNIGKSVTAKWNLQDSGGSYLGYLNANMVLAVGPVPLVNGACPLPGQVPQVLSSTQYPYPVATLYSPTSGAKGNSTFRIATSNNQFMLNWDTTPFSAGCYVLEVDLDSGQAERTTLKLQ